MESKMLVGAYLGSGTGDDLEWAIVFLEALCNGFGAGMVPRPLGAQPFFGECNNRKAFQWPFDGQK